MEPEALVNPLTACAVFHIFHLHITYQLLNLYKIKSDINQQDLTFADFHFVKSE